MKWLLALILFQPFLTLACRPNEIHIREQWIDTYPKENGTQVSAHPRSEYCREVKGQNYFQDSSAKEFRNFKGKFKNWHLSEKNILNKELEKLPTWLKQYTIASFLRASIHEGNSKNSALTYPDSKTVILFDSFFNNPDRHFVLLHEISHIATWDIDPNAIQSFLVSKGWIYKKGELPKPPERVIIPDSSHSPSEDFANSVEMYYANPKRLKEFNQKSFLILEGIIKSKEKK